MTHRDLTEIDNRWNNLEKLIRDQSVNDPTILGIDALLDAILLIHNACSQPERKPSKPITDFLESTRAFVSCVKQNRLKREDFESVEIIGRGAYGQVSVVRMKNTEHVFAMKTMKKSHILQKVESACFREEFHVLVFGDPQWITKLHYSFQDDENLYLVMEYYPGGDLLSLLAKYDNQFSEEMTRFYAAEMILAIDSLHKLGYIHRDIKPDNFVLDAQGHLRLADFGTCLRLKANGKVHCNTPVGTPDYIAPEVLRSHEDGQGTYGGECDWWSLGCVIWEMLFGSPPFNARTDTETYRLIMEHAQKKLPLEYPDDIEISNNMKNLLSQLICSSEQRMGKNGLEDFKKHPVFSSIDWNNIRHSTPPDIPEIDGPTDTSQFPEIEPDMIKRSHSPHTAPSDFTRHIPFIGITYSAHNRSNNPTKSAPVSSMIQEKAAPIIHQTIPSPIVPLIQERTPQPIHPVMSAPIPQNGRIRTERIHDSSHDQYERTKVTEYEKIIKSMEMKIKSLTDELTSIRFFYEKEREKAVEHIHETQWIRDFYTDQYERSMNEQIKYLTKIHSQLETFQNPKISRSKEKLNRTFQSLEEVRNQLDKQLMHLQASDRSYTNSADQKQKESIINQISNILSKNEPIFDQAFLSQGKEKLIINPSTDILAEPILKKLFSFLENIYKKIQKHLEEKLQLNERYSMLRRKQKIFSEWERKLYECVHDSKYSFDYFKDLVDKMAEKLDQIERNDNRRLTVTSQISTASAMEHNPLWRYNRLMKSQHMELHQVKVDLEKEREEKQLLSEESRKLQELLNQKEQENLRLKDELDALQKNFEGQALQLQTLLDNADQSNHHEDHQLLNRFLHHIFTPSPDQKNPTEVSSINGHLTREMKSHASTDLSPGQCHSFLVQTFQTPVICYACQNALVGIQRQGSMCQRCEIVCHTACSKHLRTPCQFSNIERNPLTSLDRYVVRLPRPDDLLKRWDRYYLLNAGTKLLFYKFNAEKENKKSRITPSIIIDTTDDQFQVSSVTQSDVYQANAKDISSIFRIRVSKCHIPQQCKDLFLLTANEAEKNYYIHMFSRLIERIQSLKEENRLSTGNFLVREILDLRLKDVTAAEILDADHLLILADKSLHVLNVRNSTLFRMIDRSVHQFSIIPKLNLLIILFGKQREILFKSLRSLYKTSQSSFECRIIDAKNILSFSFHYSSSTPTSLILCAAVKNQLLTFRVSCQKQCPLRYERIGESTINGSPTYLEVSNIKTNGDQEDPMIWYGFSSSFFARRIDQSYAPIGLFREFDLRLQMIRVVPVTGPSSITELLLVYSEFGIYIDYSTGRRTRSEELMWPATPKYTAYADPYLVIFTDESIEIYDVNAGLWLQSLPISRSRPLTSDGSICLTNDPELDRRYGILFHLTQPNRPPLPLNIVERSSTSTSALEKSKSSDQTIPRVISTPTHCEHLFGLDKEQGLQLMHSLPMENPSRTIESTVSTNPLEVLQAMNSLPNSTGLVSSSEATRIQTRTSQIQTRHRILTDLSRTNSTTKARSNPSVIFDSDVHRRSSRQE